MIATLRYEIFRNMKGHKKSLRNDRETFHEVENGITTKYINKIISASTWRESLVRTYVERGAHNFCTSYFWLYRVAADINCTRFHKADLLFGSSGTTWKSRRVASQLTAREGGCWTHRALFLIPRRGITSAVERAR